MRVRRRGSIGFVCVLLIAACGQEGPTPTPAASLTAPFVAYVDEVASDLDRFWMAAELAGSGYEPPSVEPYRAGELPASVCAEGTGVDEWRDTAYYCFDDRTLVYDADFLQELFADGPGMVTTVLAHEWGHHVQALTSIPEESLQRELQADCYAGVYLAPTQEEANDISLAEESLEGLVEAGNEEYRQSAWFDINEHGSPGQRWVSYITGLLTFSDPAICAGHATYEPRPPEELGGFLVAHVPGVDYQSDAGGLTLTRGRVNLRLESVEPEAMPPADATPEAQLEAIFGPYASPMVVHTTQMLATGPEARPFGQWLSASYVADAPDQPGALRWGLVRLFRAENGEGLLVDSFVIDDTQVDPEDPEVVTLMADSVTMAYAIENYLCLPGQSAEVGSGGYFFSCDIEVRE